MNKSSIERLHTKTEANRLKEQRRQQAQERREARSEEKCRGFKELAEVNRVISDDMQKLVDLSAHFSADKKAGNQSPWIVLRKPSGTEGSWVLGFVQHHGDYSTNKQKHRYEFQVYATDEESAHSAMNIPTATHVNAPDPMVESTYYVFPNYPEEDSILVRASELSPGRAIEPIAALRRKLYRDKVADKLDSLQETLRLFQDAITDSDEKLNPHLASLAVNSEIPPACLRT